MRASLKLTLVLVFVSVQMILTGQILPERQWSGYRGYLASGVLDDANLPETFDAEKMINVRWKKSIPGMGISSPVIWGEKLFITTAISSDDKAGFKPGLYGDVKPVADSSEHEWKVICINKTTGETIWEQTACKGIPKIKRHPKSTHANTSVATNGKFVVAFFGSEGLYCYDMNGNLKWKKNFGILRSVWTTMESAEWEFASSPLIYKDRLIIQCDVLENSFVATYDLKTGNEIWKADRDEFPGWCTPNIYFNSNGKPIIAVNGYKHRGGYDFESGKEIWRMSGGGDIPIPTPVTGSKQIYFNSAHGKFSPIMAISSDASGDITLKEGETSGKYVKWLIPRGGSYIHTLLFYRGRIYNVNWNGSIICLDSNAGTQIYNAKLGKASSFIASPVASDGRIYIPDEQGTVYVIDGGNEFRQIAEIPLGDICMSAPAITDGMIYFRTQNYLFAIGKK